MLTFAATVDSTQGNPEWQAITWWDKLDVIGIDAYFPLTATIHDTVQTIENAWTGNITSPVALTTPAPNYVAAMRTLADKYNKHILFTGAGYETLPDSNKTPSKTTPPPPRISARPLRTRTNKPMTC